MDIENELLTRARKLNIYLIPQYAWLILLYYLMLNCFYNLFDKFIEHNNLNFELPAEVLSLNLKMMDLIEKWIPFFLFLSIALILSGIIIAAIRYLPFIGSYKLSYHGMIGFDVGPWLFLMVITYYIFQISGSFFLIIIPIFAGVTQLLKDKLGVSFN